MKAILTILILCLAVTAGHAQQHGPLTYSVAGDQISIIDCDQSASGEIVIPDEIDGVPVTVIAKDAFADCGNITKVSIPSTVESIGLRAFFDCTAIEAIKVDEDNAHYLDLDGVLFEADLNTLIFYPMLREGDYLVPEGVRFLSEYTFINCPNLTGITLPATLEKTQSAGNHSQTQHPFLNCPRLDSINVAPGNLNFISKEGVLFDKEQTTLIRFPEGKSGRYTIPDGVISLGKIYDDLLSFGVCGTDFMSFFLIDFDDATIDLDSGSPFMNCRHLTSVVVPNSVTETADDLFRNCESLHTATFLGDAPSYGYGDFENVSPNYTSYFLSCAQGFSTPEWRGHPSAVLAESRCPAASWLVEHGMRHDTDLYQDLNSDGVSLLMAYALDLDPHQHLQSQMPRPRVSGGSLSMTIPANKLGITYIVETSTDLRTWRQDIATIRSIRGGNEQIASIPLGTSPTGYMRLVVKETPQP